MKCMSCGSNLTFLIILQCDLMFELYIQHEPRVILNSFKKIDIVNILQLKIKGVKLYIQT